MSLDNKYNVDNETPVEKRKVASPKSDLDGFFFHLLLVTVVFIFPLTLVILTVMFWS